MDEDKIFADVDEMLKVSHGLRNRIEFAEVSWLTESEALRLFESQLDISETIRDLVSKSKYAEAFILNRTIFENYFLISLMLKGTKYVLRYKVPKELGETPQQAYSRLVAQLGKQRGEGRRDIVSFRPVKNYRQIEILHQGLYSKEGDRLVPIYHFVFEEYDPVTHRIEKIPSIASKDLFAEYRGKWQKKHEALYRTYLGFENILRAAVLNGLITEEQRDRVRVHYNFLSSFTHLTKRGFELVKSYECARNAHYLRELSLLYVLRILRLYVILLIDFFSRTDHKIKDVEKLVSYLDEIGKKYDYFWFVFNGPSEYDFWNYQTAREYHRRKGKPLDEKIPYYKNPFERLKKQHKTAHELSTGLVYTSPWPRKDAFP